MLNIRKKASSSSIGAAGVFVLSLTAGFMLTGTNMAGTASFADISLAGALELPASAAVLTGSIVRSIIERNVGKNIVKIAAMIIIVIAKMFFEPKNEPKLCGITTAVSVFISGAAVSAIIGEVLYKLLFYAFYGALAGFTSYSGAVIIMGLKRQLVLDLSSASGCAYAIVYTIIIASLCSIKTPVINIGIIFGVTVTLFAAYYYRHIGGVLCGALTTCGAFIASTSCGMSVVLLPAAGLLTGYLYKVRSWITAVFFGGLCFMLTVLTGITQNSIYSMLDIISGALIFAAVSPAYSDKWVMTSMDCTAALPELLGSRMNFLADSIETVRKESGKISEMLSRNTSRDNEIGSNSSTVCSNCFRRHICWKSDYDRTMRGFRSLSRQSEITKESFPYELDECLHKDELSEVFEKSAQEKATAKLLEMRFADSQRLLHEQIKIMEEIIETAGERIDVRYSEPISKVIRDKLRKFDFSPKNVIAYYNSQNRLLVELYFAYSDAPESFTRICDLISDELRIPLDSAEPVHSGKELRIRLYERPEYSIEVYGASMCAENSKENGDTSMVFSDGTGISYVILSDGMGSGKNAAIESRLVVRMFRKLISSGVNYSSAIKLINSIMVTKSRDEAFATLDAVRIDLDKCGLTVIKSGASATLIRHRGSVMKISSPTFPIGIYEQSDTFSKSYDFEEGDIIIMFSDGIDETEYLFIKELLLSGSELKYIVDEICAKAEVFNQTARSDDVTVIGVKVTKS